MKVAINSGLGDAVYFLPFAVAIRKRGDALMIGGNRWAADVCALAGLDGVTFEPDHTVFNAPDDFIVAKIRRHGDLNYIETYTQATNCAPDLQATRQALGYAADGAGGYLLCDYPRKSGLGQMTYTPNEQDYSAALAQVSGFFSGVRPVVNMPTLAEMFEVAANAAAGLGQIGFLTALCWLYGKPFYAVRGNNETDESFEKRRKVVML